MPTEKKPYEEQDAYKKRNSEPQAEELNEDEDSEEEQFFRLELKRGPTVAPFLILKLAELAVLIMGSRITKNR